MTEKQTRGMYLALATAVISGVSIFLNKFAVDSFKEPLAFTTIKNLGVTTIMLLILLGSGKWRKILSLGRRELVNLLAIGVIGGAIPFYLFFTGLSTIPAVNGALIHKTLVIWVAIMAVPFLKEKLSKTTALALVILFGANALVGGFNGFKFSGGEILVMLATILWAGETILAKKILKNTDPDILTTARMGFGAIILLIPAVLSASKTPGLTLNLSTEQWFWLGVTVVLLLGYVNTWYRALKYAPAIMVTAVLAGSTLVTNALSAIFITHSFNIISAWQSILICTGTVMLLRKGKVHEGEQKISPAL